MLPRLLHPPRDFKSSLAPSYSLYIKKLVWFQLFGDQLANELVSLTDVQDDEAFLQFIMACAIEQHIAAPIEAHAA